MLLSAAEHQGIESDLIPKIATGFCSGVAQTGGMCGAYSGAVMALSMVHGRDAAAAARHYARASSLRPGDAMATYDLGVALQDLGRFEEAIAAYERGKKHFYQKRGQLNMACADCHRYLY